MQFFYSINWGQYNEINPILDNKEKLLEGKYIDEIDEEVSVFIGKVWDSLIPFEFTKENKKHGLNYLENILENTQRIIKDAKIEKLTEAKIYKAVKKIIGYSYPRTRIPSRGFESTIKTFHADILVPELQVAIEYKYANNENKLKNAFDQVSSDVKGYTPNSDFKIFYAVFYVTEDFWSRPKFTQVWKEMDFPDNWKGYYIVGNK